MTNHNEPSASDFDNEIGALNLEMDGFEGVEITSDNAPDLRDIIARSTGLSKRIDAARKEAKKPHLDAGKAVDADYKKNIFWTSMINASAKEILQPFLIAEQKKADEAAARARRVAERLKENELLSADTEKRAVAAEKAIKTATQIHSQAGIARAISLRTRRVANVIDPVALVRHYENQEVIILLANKLANTDIRAAKGEEITIPGVEIITEKYVS